MDIQLWKEILAPYELAVDELVVKFNHVINEYNSNSEYCPIEQVKGRVKRISSILEKVQKKGISIDEIEGRIYDIAGVRIICRFVEDISIVVDMIRKRKDMKIVQEKDYITHSKPSGYRSYHVIVKYVVHTSTGEKEIQAEIQIRTLAMDFWATIEHSLQYKYEYNIPDYIKAKLSNAAKAIDTLDNEMTEVREEIMNAKNSMQLKDNLVSDILNSIQNLYRVANKKEVVKIQEEFLKIYEKSDVFELQKFHRELDIISETYRAQSIDYD